MLTNAIDKVVIRGSFAIGKAETPLGDLDIQVSVDVGPEGDAYEDDGEIDPDSDIPRFASDPTAPVSVIGVESDQTTLSLPYALSNGVFDTGIAISNMNTGDEQSGTITFQLYQTGEEMVEYETTDELAAGGTMAILLSEILTRAGGGNIPGLHNDHYRLHQS